MNTHESINAQYAFEKLFNLIMRYGQLKNGTKYIRNVSLTLYRPLENEINTPWRKWNKQYADIEWNWYLSGNRNPEMVEKHAKLWSSIKDDSGYVNSNYGNWWLRNDQYQRMLDLLRKDKLTRRAVIVHYDVDEVQDYSKDTPCNIVLNFFVENNEICLTIFARSIDLVYGFCNDQYCFSKLLESCAESLGLNVGYMHYFITDLHIYQKHWNMNEKSI